MIFVPLMLVHGCRSFKKSSDCVLFSENKDVSVWRQWGGAGLGCLKVWKNRNLSSNEKPAALQMWLSGTCSHFEQQCWRWLGEQNMTFETSGKRSKWENRGRQETESKEKEKGQRKFPRGCACRQMHRIVHHCSESWTEQGSEQSFRTILFERGSGWQDTLRPRLIWSDVWGHLPSPFSEFILETFIFHAQQKMSEKRLGSTKHFLLCMESSAADTDPEQILDTSDKKQHGTQATFVLHFSWGRCMYQELTPVFWPAAVTDTWTPHGLCLKWMSRKSNGNLKWHICPSWVIDCCQDLFYRWEFPGFTGILFPSILTVFPRLLTCIRNGGVCTAGKPYHNTFPGIHSSFLPTWLSFSDSVYTGTLYAFTEIYGNLLSLNGVLFHYIKWHFNATAALGKWITPWWALLKPEATFTSTLDQIGNPLLRWGFNAQFLHCHCLRTHTEIAFSKLRSLREERRNFYAQQSNRKRKATRDKTWNTTGLGFTHMLQKW